MLCIEQFRYTKFIELSTYSNTLLYKINLKKINYIYKYNNIM